MHECMYVCPHAGLHARMYVVCTSASIYLSIVFVSVYVHIHFFELYMQLLAWQNPASER